MKIVAQSEHDQLPSLPLAEVAGIASRRATGGIVRVVPSPAARWKLVDRIGPRTLLGVPRDVHQSDLFDMHRVGGQCLKAPHVGSRVWFGWSWPSGPKADDYRDR